MVKNMTGYVYVALLLLILIAFGFVLSGGLILSKKSFSTAKNDELYKLVDKEAVPSQPTLQMSTLDLTPCGLGGLDIALVIDTSGSIDDGELEQMKKEVISFVGGFAESSTLFAITRFDSTAGFVIEKFTEKLDDVKKAIGSVDGNGSTNWQDALAKAQITLRSDSNRSLNPDLVVFISDGNPNTIIDEQGRSKSLSDSAEDQKTALDAAIPIANQIKADGATILALGIGDSLNPENLRAISGTTTGPVLDEYVIITTFNTLKDAFSKLTVSTCSQ